MLGGFKDRWELPFTTVQKAVDHAILLLQKTIEYLNDAQKLTVKASKVTDKLETLIDAEIKIKDFEAQRAELEVEIMRLKLEETSKSRKAKSPKKGGKKS